MGLSIEDVASLNERIEGINVMRAKLEAKQEMLLKRLDEEVSVYADKFGVSLRGNTLEETINLVREEAKKVQDRVSKEYEFKNKIVSLIEEGDIAEANKMLGINNKDEEEEKVDEEERNDNIVEGTSGGESGSECGSAGSGREGSGENAEGQEKPVGRMPGYDDVEDDDVEPNVYNFGGDFSFDDEDDGSSEGSPDNAGEGSADNDPFKGISFDFGLGEDEENGDGSSEGMPDDFGFGAMLSGSKYDFS